jgi:hypothetical protein
MLSSFVGGSRIVRAIVENKKGGPKAAREFAALEN